MFRGDEGGPRLRAARFVAPAVALALACVSGARAQESSADSAAAEALFRRGVELMRAGKPAEACPKLAESQRLDPTSGATSFALAECYEATGKTASALAMWGLARQIAVKKKLAARQEEASRHIDALEGRVPRLTVSVAPSLAKLEGLEVRRDDTLLGQGSWGEALPVDPGEHVVRAAAKGKVPFEQRVRLDRPGEGVTVKVELSDEAPAASGTPSAAPPVAEPRPPAGASGPGASPLRPVGYALGAVGAVGAGVGLFLAFKGASDASAAVDRKGSCRGEQACQRGANDDYAAAKSGNRLGLIVAGIGGAALVGGVILLFTLPPGAPVAGKRVRVSPLVGADGAGLALSGRF